MKYSRFIIPVMIACSAATAFAHSSKTQSSSIIPSIIPIITKTPSPTDTNPYVIDTPIPQNNLKRASGMNCTPTGHGGMNCQNYDFYYNPNKKTNPPPPDHSLDTKPIE